jgi:hypothetical protein
MHKQFYATEDSNPRTAQHCAGVRCEVRI